MWESYKKDWSKKYDTFTAEQTAFANFLSNLKLADARNAAETGTAIHGITKFSDISQEEFEKRYLKTIPTDKKSAAIERDTFAPVNST